ncbi:MAG: elongation factor 1-beta [Candidatus Aenigmatarchaeota archaeon]|nr:MAG: elongation factor 1-beta [Candidatus Aenigmarchaeota archaeon]
MGDVILVYKILPKDPSKFEQVKTGLDKIRHQRIEDEPIGFGVTAIKFTAMVPDEGGKQEELENQISAIDGVGEMELVHFSRSM